MDGKTKAISNENIPSRQGIIISSIIIFAGLLPDIQWGNIKIDFPDSILVLLIGFSALFFFLSLRVNEKEWLDGKGNHWITMPNHLSPLSKTIRKISIFLVILAILRVIFISLGI